jgi:hypothetical protein
MATLAFDGPVFDGARSGTWGCWSRHIVIALPLDDGRLSRW